MMLAILLTICGIMFILALLYILGCLLEKHMQSRQKKYQEHIDDLVEELFPPSIPAAIQDSSAIDTTVQDKTVQEAAVIESDPQYQEAKRKMVADIRTYFNQRKINAAIAKIPGPDELAPVNPSAGSYGDRGTYEELTFPTPPSIERLME
jgi:hypothetical protein